MDFYKSELNAIKKRGILRKRKVFCESNHKSCEFKKTLADFASNDYLGLSNRIDSLRKAYKLATNPKLSAPRASMLVNGYSKLHRRLERRLARINGFESCILVGSGFLANIALIESLVRKGDKIFIDSEYHASGILASKLVQGVEFFRHNDCADLENKIRNYLENSPLPCGWGQRGWVNSQNNSSAQFSNNESTPPLTPSAREGESIDLPCNDEMVANLESKIDSSLRESAVADSWQSTGFTKETSATPRFANAVKQPSKSSDLKKQSESRTEKQINADSLQVRVSQNAQSLHNRLPRESCGFLSNDEVGMNCHDSTQSVESRSDGQKTRIIIAIEGIYSMSGDIAPKGFAQIAQKYNAILIVDEAHSSGTLGQNLLGYFDYHRIKIAPNFIKLGTFSKALGSYGAYILSSAHINSYLQTRAKPIIYSTALSAFDSALALTNLNFIHKNRVRFAQKIARIKKIIQKNLKIKLDSQIFSIQFQSQNEMLKTFRNLKKRGILVGAIRTPSVKIPQLRIILSTKHSKKDIIKLCKLLKK